MSRRTRLAAAVLALACTCDAFVTPTTRKNDSVKLHALNTDLLGAEWVTPLLNQVKQQQQQIQDSLTQLATGTSTATTTTPFSFLSTIPTSIFTWYTQQLPLPAQVALAMIPVSLIFFAFLLRLSFPTENYRANMEPYLRGQYDPVQANLYYAQHPWLVARRALQVLRSSSTFLTNLAFDKYILRDEEKFRQQRAKQLLELITRLGPTAIKVGQALSVRPDLIPPEYANTLATLQDQVPPFDTDAAKTLLLSQLGPQKFAQISSTLQGPVASASIGQVYKATLADGTQVAVKVQRPNVLSEISLDLYLVRSFAPYYQRITKSATDLQGLANEWGRGFIAELDYRQEAKQTIRFTQEMQKRGLNAVCAPTVITDLSTEQILVTEWVDGTRLDQSFTDDVPRLCAVALNAYLVMLLELQSLHCDPHPGNLLRTKDGKLCILDFGMTLETAPSLQYALLEFVAHLTSNEYDRLPEDLAALGFLKPDKLDFARRSGSLEPLKYFLEKAGQGGGAKGVQNAVFAEYRLKYPGLDDTELRVAMRSEMKAQMQTMVENESVATGITVEVEELQRRNRDSFQIPEWFLYTSRAFLTLEGVSLGADENYSIIKSCFPYIAKRLIADDDPRARKALKELLYGASNSVNIERLSDLADGFSSYTKTTKTINKQAPAHSGELVLSDGSIEPISKLQDRKDKLIETEAAITLAKDSADILLAKDGNLVQNLLIEEGALATSARIKDALRDAFVDGPKRFRDTVPFGQFLPPLFFEDRAEALTRKTVQELKAQELAAQLALIVTKPASKSGPDGPDIKEQRANNSQQEAWNIFVQSIQQLEPEQTALVLKELRENIPRYGPLLSQLSERYWQLVIENVRSNVDSGKQRTSPFG